MPHKDKKAYNSYMKEYMLKRYTRRIEAAKVSLGGKCTQCGSTDNLQFDHIDPSTKQFVIGKLWSLSESKFQSELQKCQLPCMECHIKKTAIDINRPLVKGKHGTTSTYRYCRCDECKRAHNEYCKEYRKIRKE